MATWLRPNIQTLNCRSWGQRSGVDDHAGEWRYTPVPQSRHYASYCRCVGSEKLSNGKSKGRGNSKNGNKYLSWAFVEAANFAILYDPKIKRYYQHKRGRSHAVVAIKTVAQKLAKACFYLLRDQVPFDMERAFA